MWEFSWENLLTRTGWGIFNIPFSILFNLIHTRYNKIWIPGKYSFYDENRWMCYTEKNILINLLLIILGISQKNRNNSREVLLSKNVPKICSNQQWWLDYTRGKSNLGKSLQKFFIVIKFLYFNIFIFHGVTWDKSIKKFKNKL